MGSSTVTRQATWMPEAGESASESPCRFPADRRRLTWTGRVAVRAVVQPGGSAGAKLVVEHDGAAGGVVREVRAQRLALGGSARCTQRGRIVEVGLEHAEIRRLALGRGDVEP